MDIQQTEKHFPKKGQSQKVGVMLKLG